MNVVEKLGREIARVVELREKYRALDGQPQVNVAMTLAMMDAALNAGFDALGSGDSIECMRAVECLEGFSA